MPSCDNIFHGCRSGASSKATAEPKPWETLVFFFIVRFLNQCQNGQDEKRATEEQALEQENGK